MAFSAAILLTSPINYGQRTRLENALFHTWPFLQRFQLELFTDRLLLAPPETTDDLYSSSEALDLAYLQSDHIFQGLPHFSKHFPAIKFAYIEAECYYGVCIYGGFVCQAGKMLKELIASEEGHKILLAELDIEIENEFEPFSRNFFSQHRVSM